MDPTTACAAARPESKLISGGTSRFALRTLISRLADLPTVWALAGAALRSTEGAADAVGPQLGHSPEYVMERHLAVCQLLGVRHDRGARRIHHGRRRMAVVQPRRGCHFIGDAASPRGSREPRISPRRRERSPVVTVTAIDVFWKRSGCDG
jgi:hypothetical protein